MLKKGVKKGKHIPGNALTFWFLGATRSLN